MVKQAPPRTPRQAAQQPKVEAPQENSSRESETPEPQADSYPAGSIKQDPTTLAIAVRRAVDTPDGLEDWGVMTTSNGGHASSFETVQDWTDLVAAAEPATEWVTGAVRQNQTSLETAVRTALYSADGSFDWGVVMPEVGGRYAKFDELSTWVDFSAPV